MKHFNLIFLATLVSCGIGGAKSPLNFAVNIEEPVRAEEVNFEVLKERVLPKCLGCHKDWTSEEVVNRFTKESNPEQSRLYTTILDGTMPKNSPSLSPILKEITRNYIQNIVYNPPVEEPLPDDLKVDFNMLNEKVFKISCLPCHSARALKDEASLQRWVNKADPEQSKLLLSVTSGKMPKQRNLLTPNQVEMIRRYVKSFGPK
ncbi:MAG: hypothetical protein V4598_06685 [Bdellovibrionota bacterium]